MSYTVGSVAKAIAAFATAALGAATVAAGGPDLTVLSFGEIVGSLGAGLVAFGATFRIRNEDTESVTERVVAGIPVVLQQAQEAQANLDKVRQATTDALGNIPVFGEEARRIVNGLRF